MPSSRSSIVSDDRWEPRLLRAAENDDVEALKHLIELAHRSGQFCDKFLYVSLKRSCESGSVAATRYLLRLGDKTAAATHSQSSFLRAVERNNVRIVQLLLDYGVSPEMTDKKGQTALMVAARMNHRDILLLLISRGANVNAKDYRKRNVLHNLAADMQCDWGEDVVQLLLTTACCIDGVDELKRTPLHWACATGKLRFTEMLLTRTHGPVAEIDAVEHRNKTPLHIAVDHSREDIVQMLLRYEANVNARSDGGWTALHYAADRGSEAIVRLLLHAGAMINSQLLNGITPLHLAAQGGHRVVVECLLERPDLKRHVRDKFGCTPFLRAAQFKRKDILALLAPFNNVDNLAPDARAACEGFEATIVDFGNFANENHVRRISVYDLLYGRDPQSPHKSAFSTIPADKATDFRWIHLPANNMAWVEALLIKSFIEEGAHDVDSFKGLEKSYRYQHRGQLLHSHFMWPMCQSMPRNNSLYLFMPYLHFETAERRQKMQEAIQRAETLRFGPPGIAQSPTRDEMLTRAYLATSGTPLHVRRTLRQFFYPNSDTQTRDQDQVLYRYQSKGQERHKLLTEPKIFMVDQLWMWIIGTNLIVTSFAQRWEQPKNDPLNVLNDIIEDINSKTREPVRSVYDLAAIITNSCAGIFDRHRMEDEEYQFLGMFESYIGIIMDRATLLFNLFNSASAQLSNWLKYHCELSRFGRAAYEEEQGGQPLVDNLLEIGQENDLLSEAKDIRDELNMIRTVLEHQQHVLSDFQGVLCEIYQKQQQNQYHIKKRFKEQQRTIELRLKDIERMDKQTERIYSSVMDLLDLKQKQANIFEARFARDQLAAGTTRQGKTIMVFTIVTIVFLPLSFITSIFTINLAEFKDANGNEQLHLSYVAKYTFGVGFAISIPLVLLALSIDDVKDVCQEGIRRLRGRMFNRNNELIGSQAADNHPRVREMLEIERALNSANGRRSVGTGFAGNLVPVSTRGSSQALERRHFVV